MLSEHFIQIYSHYLSVLDNFMDEEISFFPYICSHFLCLCKITNQYGRERREGHHMEELLPRLKTDTAFFYVFHFY